MTYNIKFENEALGELDKILDYIALELSNKQAAIKLFDDIMKALHLIQDFPHSVPMSRYHESNSTRQLTVNNFTLFYFIDEEVITIIVLQIMYAKSDIIQQVKKKPK